MTGGIPNCVCQLTCMYVNSYTFLLINVIKISFIMYQFIYFFRLLLYFRVLKKSRKNGSWQNHELQKMTSLTTKAYLFFI